MSWIDIEDATGNAVFDGPLYNIKSATTRQYLNKAGSFDISAISTDPRANIKNRHRVHFTDSRPGYGAVKTFSGIVNKPALRISPSGADLKVGGLDNTLELIEHQLDNVEIAGTNEREPEYCLFNSKGGGETDILYFIDTLGEYSLTFDDSEEDFIYYGDSARIVAVYNGVSVTNSTAVDNTKIEEPTGSYWPNGQNLADGTQVIANVPGGQDGWITWDRLQGITKIAHGEQQTNGPFTLYWVRHTVNLDATNINYSVDDIKVRVLDRATDDLTQLMAYAPTGWTIDIKKGVGSTRGTMNTFNGSFMEALTKIAEQSGDSFTIDSANRKIIWFGQVNHPKNTIVLQQSPLGAVSVPANTAYYENLTFEESSKPNTYMTRAKIIGSGAKLSEITIAKATDTLPSGFSYNTLTGYIVNDDLETALGEQITGKINVSSIGPVIGTGNNPEAANAMLWAGYEKLKKAGVYETAWTLDIVAINGELSPGDKVRLFAHFNNNAGESFLNTNDEYYVTEIVTRRTRTNSRMTLRVSNLPEPKKTVNEKLADKLQRQFDITERTHSVPLEMIDGELTGVGGGGGGGGSSHDAITLTAAAQVYLGLGGTGGQELDVLNDLATQVELDAHINNTAVHVPAGGAEDYVVSQDSGGTLIWRAESTGIGQHDILGSDHTLTAAVGQLLGATAANTPGLFTPTSNGDSNKGKPLITDATSGDVQTTRHIADHYISNKNGLFRGDIHRTRYHGTLSRDYTIADAGAKAWFWHPDGSHSQLFPTNSKVALFAWTDSGSIVTGYETSSYRSSTTNAAGATAVTTKTGTVPSGTLQGEPMLFGALIRDEFASIVSGPSGFTQIGTTAEGQAYGMTLVVYHKDASADDAANAGSKTYEIEISSADGISVGMVTLQNVASGLTFDSATFNINTNASSTTAASGNVSLSSGEGIVVAFSGMVSSSPTFTAPSTTPTTTERFEIDGTNPQYMSLSFFDRPITGDTGNQAIDATISGGGADSVVCIIALKAKEITGTGNVLRKIWCTATNFTDENNNEQSYTLTPDESGFNGTKVHWDMTAQGYGVSGDYYIAMGEGPNAPYIRLMKWETDITQNANHTIIASLGDLDSSGALGTVGVYFKDNSDNVSGELTGPLEMSETDIILPTLSE